MFRGFRVGSVAGIPIKLDVTFLLILPVLAYLIGSGMADAVTALNAVLGAGLDAEALTAGATPWAIGFASATGLFVCVLLHELGHAAVARRYGYETESITLWLLGGIARPEERPERWNHELWIALGGPVVSVALGVGCFVAINAVPSEPWRFVVSYLAVLNIVLAGFNMLPAFPLDGGRVLRALLGRTRSHAAATELAVSVGKSFAVVLAIIGIVAFNPFLVAVAFFVYIAAAAEGRRTALAATFEGVRVADVMTPASELSAVEPTESLAEVLDRMFGERHTGYPVLESGRLVGVVTLSDIRDVAPDSRATTTIEEAMSTDLETVGPDTEAMEAMTRLERGDVGRLPVVDRTGALVGLVTRSDLVTAMTVIRERRADR
ncbi:MAG: Zn-dependent protease/CBS domain-containing protein [Natronomonas sp.]|jgi:Zn-dependent protease/CBS domain-containing protein|uniref:CBS domain-containing protein n=1 Tax=Natronomonas sp. TaxID=2184060 RepID=UPI0039891351